MIGLVICPFPVPTGVWQPVNSEAGMEKKEVPHEYARPHLSSRSYTERLGSNRNPDRWLRASLYRKKGKAGRRADAVPGHGTVDGPYRGVDGPTGPKNER